jgi:hypothetical protein
MVVRLQLPASDTMKYYHAGQYVEFCCVTATGVRTR